MKKIEFNGKSFTCKTNEEALAFLKGNGAEIDIDIYDEDEDARGEFSIGDNFIVKGKLILGGGVYMIRLGGDVICDGDLIVQGEEFVCGGDLVCKGNFRVQGACSIGMRFYSSENFYSGGEFTCDEDVIIGEERIK